jgi:5-methylcytosine-specific restriction enzyme subunit McrC
MSVSLFLRIALVVTSAFTGVFMIGLRPSERVTAQEKAGIQTEQQRQERKEFLLYALTIVSEENYGRRAEIYQELSTLEPSNKSYRENAQKAQAMFDKQQGIYVDKERRLTQGTTWKYNTQPDDMGSGTIRFAALRSTNEFSFGFPYASGLARFLEPFSTKIDSDAELPDVLGRLLCFAVEKRLRRGLSRGYRPRFAELDRVRGRIDWLKTEAGQLLSRGKISCRFEELTHDTARNRYVLSALMKTRSTVKDRALVDESGRLIRTFVDIGVKPLQPSRSEMSRDRIARNDADDELVLRVAEIVLELMLPSEESGGVKLTRLDHDEKLLRKIFERGVAGFYIHEVHRRDGWKVRRQPQFEWDTSDATEGLPSILPKMQADVVLQKDSARRIILDTKFTGILTPRLDSSEGLKSAHLYQIYSYIRSQAGRSDALADVAEGILLYPSLNRHLDEAVTIQGHRMRFATIDLAASAEEIRNRLREIIHSPR